jgi:parallel beta-helix repeat protein
MKKNIIALLIVLLFIFNIIIIYTPENIVKGTNVSGPQYGVWDVAGSPYIVTDYINVTSDGYLDIRPGVEVRFKLDTVFEIWGLFWANGTKSNPIKFTSDLGSPYPGSWEGINVELTGVAQFKNCSISYAESGINATSSTKLKFQHGEIFYCINGTSLEGVSMASIENSTIHDNLNIGVDSLWGFGYIRVMNNTVYNNAIGIKFEYTDMSVILNNSIYNNMVGISVHKSRYTVVWNNTIVNSNFPPPTPEAASIVYSGLNLERGRRILIINNTIINSTNFGIRVRYTNNNTIMFNYIKNTTKSGYTITKSKDNYFKNNTIIASNESSIIFKFNSKRNRFHNTTIIRFNNRYAVEYLHNDTIFNWFATNNTVNNVPLRIYYDVSGEILSNDLTGLNVNEPLLTNLGQVLIINCSNFTIHSLSVENGNTGIFFYMAKNGTLENSTIDKIKDYAINFGFNSTNLTIINTSLTIPITASGYFYLGKYSNITTLNTTFDLSKVIFNTGSNLTVQWFMHVEATGISTNQKLSNAVVKVYDKFNTLIYNGTTNAKGQVRHIVCTFKTRSDKRTRTFTNHNVTVFKLHYQLGYARPEPFMDRNRWVKIYLPDNKLPTLIGVVRPPNTHNLTPTISWNAGTDPDNDKLEYWINIWNIKQSGIILETNSTYNTNYNLETVLSYGERYSVNVTAYDNFGGWSNTIIGSFDVINNGPLAPIISISPPENDKEPSKNVDLNCSIVKESIDIDKNPVDTILYSYLWYKDGILQENVSIRNTSELFHILKKEFTETGEIWTCRVTATDGFALSPTVSEFRLIKNTPPYVDITLPRLRIPEDSVDVGSIKLPRIFKDDDLDLLRYNYTITGDNITLEILPNGTVIVTPKPNWNGYEIATFTASDDEAFDYINTKIIVEPVPDEPEVEIVLPKTDKLFIYNSSLLRGIRFVGVYEDLDIPYGTGDEINLTWVSNISGILGYERELDNIILPIGDHKIEFIARDSYGLSDIDSIIIHVISEDEPPPEFIIPEVKLLGPLHNDRINISTVTLSWTVLNLNQSALERVLFDVYFDTSEVPRKIIRSDYLNNNLTIQVEDNTTYYWTVIPYLDDFSGKCIDFVWNFTIDLNFTSIFGVILNMLESDLIIHSGKNSTFNFTIENVGNVVDKFSITLAFLNDNEIVNYTIIEFDNITLQSLRNSMINITFNIPLNYTRNNDTMIIFASSMISPANTFISRNLTIIGKSPIPVEEVTEKIPDELITLLFWLIIIMIVIIIILIIFIMLFISWIRRQSKMNYPIKTKRIFRKERSKSSDEKYKDKDTDKKVSSDETKLKTKSDELDVETKGEGEDEKDKKKDKEKTPATTPAERITKATPAKATPARAQKPPKAKPAPAGDAAKSSKISTVTPIKLASLMSRDSDSKVGFGKGDDAEHDEKKATTTSGSKPVAKPVHDQRTSASKKDSKESK